ncbi:Uncharacterized conserved protein, DUF2252 family [Gracilibacillus orientalis]|uniref:Uncharacterized conserved protein, DUF2252 family n=1 Tax=Gracilibacillus orientalis TaxID=334253 RepID=A0A1I4N9F0_9BACI|nr:DUF2252 family protein [Gracilibacillus orientalis]SFM12005.1 Uncharacterized conserved protein, DUF2252 family [Gracilibacillus orientalis]
MVHSIQTKVQETSLLLRKQSLHTILEQLDSYVMELSKKDRRKKYHKMKQNPYSFYRGSAYLFYYDVTKIPFSFHTPEHKPTWIMGDMHFDNFSSFQDEAGHLVFDVDDFDEGYLGSYLYDVLRMVVSIRLLAEQQGITDEENRDELVTTFLKAYRKQIKKFAKREDDPKALHFTVDNAKGPIKNVLNKLEERQATHELHKQTTVNDEGERVFNLEKEKLEKVSPKEYKEIKEHWDYYLDSIESSLFKGNDHYQIKDIVKKTGAGVASTGLKRYYVLIEGTNELDNDDVILEVKEARPAIPAYFVPYNGTFWDYYKHQGERVVATQKAMHHKTDAYLGHLTIGNREFYVRERCAYDKDISPKHLNELKPIKQSVKIMGKIAAKIHARADQDINEELLDYHSEDVIYQTIEGNKDAFIQEMVLWSRFYKRQVEQDYELFLDWLETYFYKS